MHVHVHFTDTASHSYNERIPIPVGCVIDEFNCIIGYIPELPAIKTPVIYQIHERGWEFTDFFIL